MDIKRNFIAPYRFTIHFFAGASFAVPAVLIILVFDLMNIGNLVFQTSHAPVFIGMMLVKLALVFGVAAIALSFTRNLTGRRAIIAARYSQRGA